MGCTHRQTHTHTHTHTFVTRAHKHTHTHTTHAHTVTQSHTHTRTHTHTQSHLRRADDSVEVSIHEIRHNIDVLELPLALGVLHDVLDTDDVFVPAEMPQQLQFAQQQLPLYCARVREYAGRGGGGKGKEELCGGASGPVRMLALACTSPAHEREECGA